MDKKTIADILNEIAVLLELKGENPFKIRAYQSGARALEAMEEELSEVIQEGRLNTIKGIGKALTDKIVALESTGELEYYDNLRASVAPGLLEMMEIPGLGAKKIKAIYDKLGIDSIPDLETACKEGRVAALPGFGTKSEEKIISGIANREAYGKRHLWWSANEVALPILEGLRSLEEVEHAECAGSLRRSMETVGDLDFIVGSEKPEPIMDWFTQQKDVVEVTAHGNTKSSVRFKSGLQADLRVVPMDVFFFALHHFTGSKDHNVMMRQRALSMGYSLSEWGLSPKDSDPESAAERISVESESDLFAKLGLAYITPELREGFDEIKAAEITDDTGHALPELLKDDDIRGVFHNHTTASDGRNTLEEMTQAAQDLGWEYLGIADHSKASFQANGLDADRVRKQIEQIRELNASNKFKTHVFAGIECDILPDGELDLDDQVLSELDYVVVSIHSSFTQPEEQMTKRIIRALEHPSATMLGHLTGRLLLRREPYKLDPQAVINAAIEHGKIIELNANPMRLDMDWRLWKSAAARGLICAINPDAHKTDQLEYYRAGVNTARKGWLEVRHVLNAWPLKKVQQFFA